MTQWFKCYHLIRVNKIIRQWWLDVSNIIMITRNLFLVSLLYGVLEGCEKGVVIENCELLCWLSRNRCLLHNFSISKATTLPLPLMWMLLWLLPLLCLSIEPIDKIRWILSSLGHSNGNCLKKTLDRDNTPDNVEISYGKFLIKKMPHH